MGQAKATKTDPASRGDVRRWLPWMGLGVGAWALLPVFSGPPLNTDPTVEFVDHVIPAMVIVPLCLVALTLRSRADRSRRARPDDPKPRAGLFMIGLGVLLAGLWMLATHFPLVLQAIDGEAPWAGTIYHTTSGLAVFGVGLLWSVAHWADTAEPEPKPEPEASPNLSDR